MAKALSTWLSPEQPTPRPIRGPERTTGMFGTDFSYEDLERVQHGWRPGAAEIVELPAKPVNERPAYVVELGPRRTPAWERIVFSLDPESCLPLLVRFFEPGRKLPRKELTVDPRTHVKHGEPLGHALRRSARSARATRPPT